MRKILLLVSGLFALSIFATTITAAESDQSLAEAQDAAKFARYYLDEVAAQEKQASQQLDKANKALARNPKSPKAKQAVVRAQQALDSVSVRKSAAAQDLQKKNARVGELLEHMMSRKAAIFPTNEFSSFIDKFNSMQKLDAYFFFMDPLEYKDKSVILDAVFEGNTPTGEAKFTIWRNFGKMHLIVSNLPQESAIPMNQIMLLAGTITGFKKEVVSDELILKTLLKVDGAYFCKDSNCNTGHL